MWTCSPPLGGRLALRRLLASLWVLAVALGPPGMVGAAGPRSDRFAEREVKAVFVYNFAHYVHWPDTPARRPPEAFRYCVLDDELATVLEKVVQGETLDGRPLMVVRRVDPKNLAQCHVLYMDRADLASTANQELVVRAAAAGVLTVSDREDFAAKGGIIALIRKQGRVHPLINLDAAARAQVRISSKLLSLATPIHDGDGADPP